jgi:hypothetical protein
MKAYHEYLELHGYFALPGEPRLSRAAFDEADREYRALAARHPALDAGERARLRELKAALFRDKP